MTSISELSFRILIVDDESFADNLRLRVRNLFPSAQIHVAKTVAEARSLIRKLAASGETFDLAVIDFRLPANTLGDHPQPETGLKAELREVDPTTRIMRVTAFHAEPMLKAMGELEPDCEYLEDAFEVKKGDPSGRIAEWIPKAYHTRRIKRQMDSLLAGKGALQSRARSGHEVANDRGQALDFSMFFLDAGQHWSFLTPRLQQDLARAFGHADLGERGHLVGVVPDHPVKTEHNS